MARAGHPPPRQKRSGQAVRMAETSPYIRRMGLMQSHGLMNKIPSNAQKSLANWWIRPACKPSFRKLQHVRSYWENSAFRRNNSLKSWRNRSVTDMADDILIIFWPVFDIIGRVDFVNFQIPKMSSAKKLWHDLVSQKIFW